jgi:hypothetical protein
MSVATTTLQVNFVSESADNANTFGWHNSVTGLGGVLFADVEREGRNAPLTAGRRSELHRTLIPLKPLLHPTYPI